MPALPTSMKEQIRSAQIVLPCRELNRTLEFFTERLGFRLEMIFPADSPATAVISGYGLTLRLESSLEYLLSPVTLRLAGDFSALPVDDLHEIPLPDGIRIIFIDESSIEIPDAVPEFVLTTLESENSWAEGRAGMQYRDLIPGRLGGRFIASHIRIPEGGEIPDYVHYHKIRFQMIYCLSGWARLVYENQGGPFLMEAGDCVLQPPEIRHRVLESSPRFEVLEIGCPAVHETFADHQLNLPNDTPAPEKIFSGQRFVHHRAAEAKWEPSYFNGFESCNTGIEQATNGLADVLTLRAVEDSGFSVNHAGEFLFFFVLSGNLRFIDSGGISHLLEKGSSFVLPAGSRYSLEAKKGTHLLQISLPA